MSRIQNKWTEQIGEVETVLDGKLSRKIIIEQLREGPQTTGEMACAMNRDLHGVAAWISLLLKQGTIEIIWKVKTLDGGTRDVYALRSHAAEFERIEQDYLRRMPRAVSILNRKESAA